MIDPKNNQNRDDAAASAIQYPCLASASPFDTETLSRHLAAHPGNRLQGLAQQVAEVGRKRK